MLHRELADAGLVYEVVGTTSKRMRKSRVYIGAGAKKSLKIWAGRAVGAAIEAARAGAGKVSDIIDEKMQEEFDKVAKTSTKTLLSLLFLRDLGMAASPLVAFAILPIVL